MGNLLNNKYLYGDKIAEAKSVMVGRVRYIFGYDNTISYQLWKTDNTRQGIPVVKVINSNSPSAISDFIVFNGLVFLRQVTAARPAGVRITPKNNTIGNCISQFSLHSLNDLKS
jgi:hypothetical protein